MQNLNRIGIILNFLAGFLLAPELIGLENLRKFEQSLERAAANLNQKVANNVDHIQTRIKKLKKSGITVDSTGVFFSSLLFFAISGGALFFIFYAIMRAPVAVRYIALGYLLILFPLFLFLSISMAKELPYSPAYHELRIFENLPWDLDDLLNGMILAGMVINYLVIPIPFNIFIALLAVALVTLYIVLLILFFRLIILPVVFIRSILTFVLKILAGEERLQAIIKTLGVLLFIVGNALDFISTF